MSKHTYRHPRESQGLLPQFLFLKINIPMDLCVLLLRKYQLHSTELYKHVRAGTGCAWWLSCFEEVHLDSYCCSWGLECGICKKLVKSVIITEIWNGLFQCWEENWCYIMKKYHLYYSRNRILCISSAY